MTRWTATGVALACAASLAGGIAARADDVSDRKRDAERRISTLNQELEGTNEKLADAYVKLRRTSAALPGAQERLETAEAAVTRAQSAQAQAEAVEARAVAAEEKARAHNEAVAQRLAVARAKEASAKEKLAASAAALATSQDALDAYAAEVFQGNPDQSQLGLVFGSTSPGELAERMVMSDTASAVAEDTVNRLAATTADRTATKAYLTAVRAEIDELKKEAEIALASAEAASAAAAQARAQAVIAKDNAVTARQNASAAKTALDTLKKEQQAFAGELRQERGQIEKELEASRAEAARLQAILAERARLAKIAEQKRLAKLEAERQAKIRAEQAKAAAAKKKGQSYTPKTPPPVSQPTGWSLGRPAYGPTTSGFGMRWHPVLQKWLLHDGLDWALACGTPVYASADGTIIRAGWRASGWGNQVLIDHGIHRGVDVVTSYNHLSSIVRWGGTVRRGQLIGYSGTTGYSTGCHLHFGVYEDGTPVDPWKWL